MTALVDQAASNVRAVLAALADPDDELCASAATRHRLEGAALALAGRLSRTYLILNLALVADAMKERGLRSSCPSRGTLGVLTFHDEGGPCERSVCRTTVRRC